MNRLNLIIAGLGGNIKGILVLILFAAFILGLIIFGPLLPIWALNVIFGLGIEYTFLTWLASIILCGVISNTVTK